MSSLERDRRIAFLKGPAGERALIARLLAGDEPAFRECYELHAPALLRLLARMVRNQALAEELLQETFLSAFANLGTFREEARLSTWLTGIGVRRALNALRGESRRLKHLPAPPDPLPSPEPWLAERDASRRVLALLDELDPAKRLALLLFADGYTAAEIAEVTGEPRGTILSRLARSRAELAERAAEAGLSADAEVLAKGGQR